MYHCTRHISTSVPTVDPLDFVQAMALKQNRPRMDICCTSVAIPLSTIERGRGWAWHVTGTPACHKHARTLGYWLLVLYPLEHSSRLPWPRSFPPAVTSTTNLSFLLLALHPPPFLFLSLLFRSEFVSFSVAPFSLCEARRVVMTLRPRCRSLPRYSMHAPHFLRPLLPSVSRLSSIPCHRSVVPPDCET
ncbi:hypothetical protein NUW54_g5206 [Trametes sanguinea]|uniref:Uncharacterized protein n=1 Tax=Trametes sanguinea TaxID=158606 RepID=A0ACC1PZ78_9APHY|nr:hypothetical protein NUW54_g5206 [Trametes sanguinea]